MAELGALFDKGGIALDPVYVRDYAALYDAVHLHEADLAWAPPLVARDLTRDGAADPCVTVLRRGGGAHYFSAIVGRDSLRTPADVSRFGWVSRLSAAGYLVPRAYLKSVGIAVDSFEDHFFHTHTRSMEALRMGLVDAIATYAIRDDEIEPRVPHIVPGARVLTTIGPIPGDLIVAARSLGAEQIARATEILRSVTIGERAALASLMGASGFGEVPEHHLDLLTRWVARPVFSSRPSVNEMHGA